jgi:hypothetical protein
MKCCSLMMFSFLLPPHHQPNCFSSPMPTSRQCPQRQHTNKPIDDFTIKSERSTPHRGACSAPQLHSHSSYPRNAARQCQLTPALRLRGFSVFRLVLETYPHTGCIPPGFCETRTRTRTLGHGYGFSAIWVRVALENPRVTRANP